MRNFDLPAKTMESISSISHAQSSSQSPSLDQMTGTERAKKVLEQAIFNIKDLFAHLVKMKPPAVRGTCSTVELMLLPLTYCGLLICYQALEEEDDSDEEESDGHLHDEGTDTEEDEPVELDKGGLNENQNPVEAASDEESKSDSLTSTLASPLMRSKLERNKGLKEAKLRLERILPKIVDCCTLIVKKKTEFPHIGDFPIVPVFCCFVLCTCYKGLIDEDFDDDDSDEEQSDVNGDECSEQESEDEYIHSGGNDLVEEDEHKQCVENRTTTATLGHKRSRGEDPSHVKPTSKQRRT